MGQKLDKIQNTTIITTINLIPMPQPKGPESPDKTEHPYRYASFDEEEQHNKELAEKFKEMESDDMSDWLRRQAESKDVFEQEIQRRLIELMYAIGISGENDLAVFLQKVDGERTTSRMGYRRLMPSQFFAEFNLCRDWWHDKQQGVNESVHYRRAFDILKKTFPEGDPRIQFSHERVQKEWGTSEKVKVRIALELLKTDLKGMLAEMTQAKKKETDSNKAVVAQTEERKPEQDGKVTRFRKWIGSILPA